MQKYAFWNNKGGTGKTSLIFQSIVSFAQKHRNKKILALDLCPQANLSELMLGGLVGNGSKNLLQIQGNTQRTSVGGYFQIRLPSPFTIPKFDSSNFIVSPNSYNKNIPNNIDLLSGDPLLELQATAISTLANSQIPGVNPWLSVMDWLSNFLQPLEDTYHYAFIDCNPSFSMYTQIAISAADRIVLPVMADDSSIRALQNVFSLIYGLNLPNPIYDQYSFATKLKTTNRTLPKVHLIIKNRLTQYMGPASAYSAVLKSIDTQLKKFLKSNPTIFSFSNIQNGIVNIRDFQTTGVIAFAKGMPFSKLNPGKHSIRHESVQIKIDNIKNCIESIDKLVDNL